VNGRAVSFFYVLTVQIVNPTGGRERVASASGLFYETDTLTEEGMFANTLLAAAPALGIQVPLKPDLSPNLAKFSVLFYRCSPNLGSQLPSERKS
jgi:hypothetical protein